MKRNKQSVEIEFSAETLLERVTGFATGLEPARERMIKLPSPVKGFSASKIRALRKSLGFTQSEFAVFLNVPKVTAVSWESGVRKPSGAALRLLAVAQASPEAVSAS